MTKNKIIKELKQLYLDALTMLEETANLVPTFKIVSHSYALNSIHDERRICKIILRSALCESIEEAKTILTKVPDTENEVIKVGTVMLKTKTELNGFFQTHLENCLRKMKTRHKRVQMMSECYY